MHALVRSLGWKRFLREQGPPLLLAWVIAELFYRFHSFTLECAAFLATWYAFDLALSALVSTRLGGRRDTN